MKEIISTKTVVTDARKPSETSEVLFKDFTTYYDVRKQEEVISMNSYKVIDDEAGEYEFIRRHERVVDKVVINAIVDKLTVSTTNYTDVRNEQITKGIAWVINDEGIFGLTTADLELR